jgi:hypothetical protein
VARTTTRNLGRLSEIAQVAVRHGFGYWFDTHRLTDLFPRRGGRMELDGQPSQRGQHLREMLDELGPTFVKFGQLLSTRPDILPPDIIAELRGLQDDVRPFPFAEVEQVVEEDLGLTIDRLFVEFDERPIAAASIGQVHRAIHRYEAARRRVRAVDPPGARLSAGSAQRRDVPPQLRGAPARPRPARLLVVHTQPRADARVARRHAGRRHRSERVVARGAA